jgi:hypothetical protein
MITRFTAELATIEISTEELTLELRRVRDCIHKGQTIEFVGENEEIKRHLAYREREVAYALLYSAKPKGAAL